MKVGDRVVCVKANSNSDCPLKVNSIYHIFDINVCKCGSVSFDVGIMLPFNFILILCVCGSFYETNVWLLGSELFAPIQYSSAHDELINIVEEKLDVEIKEPAL